VVAEELVDSVVAEELVDSVVAPEAVELLSFSTASSAVI